MICFPEPWAVRSTWYLGYLAQLDVDTATKSCFVRSLRAIFDLENLEIDPVYFQNFKTKHPIPTQLIHCNLLRPKATLLEEPLRNILRPPLDMCDQPSVAFYCTQCGKPYASVFLPGKFERCQNPEPCKKIIELDGGSVVRGVCEDCTRHLVVIRALALAESERLRNQRSHIELDTGLRDLSIHLFQRKTVACMHRSVTSRVPTLPHPTPPEIQWIGQQADLLQLHPKLQPRVACTLLSDHQIFLGSPLLSLVSLV
ncbi:uncharacterized protein CLUP02_05108 [Colletotrichum lupini]|uniref:Uncharacterized protein n=1 Tax=Colletotrichum lupini TaxID=145971 RepID=A0A9Q8WDE0_9PEZI|nr:uncharacterized protein CLUP02_05108 [Colletotrichum lupini]UQC79628.1 hypothetical protein CLUP02_05108 [Colletotrichum lupini]